MSKMSKHYFVCEVDSKARPKIFLVSGGFVLEKSDRLVGNKIFLPKKDERIRLWKRMLLALEMSLFTAKGERGERVWCWRRNNSFSLSTRAKQI